MRSDCRLLFCTFGASVLAVAAIIACSGSSGGGKSDVKPQAGSGSGSDGVIQPFAAAPNGLALRVEGARQVTDLDPAAVGGDVAPRTSLQVAVTLANGVGGSAIPLNPMLFRLRTEGGELMLPSAAPVGAQGSSTAPVDTKGAPGTPSGAYPNNVVDDLLLPLFRTPNPTNLLAAGATYYGWGLQFDVNGQEAVELTYAPAAAQVDGHQLGDARSATAPIKVEACTQCGDQCTYLDVFPNLCCDGATPENGACIDHKGVCGAGLTMCGTATSRSCAELATDRDNCGACGVRTPDDAQCLAGVVQCRSAGRTAVNGACVDLQSDALNCGAPGVKTPQNASCVAGNVKCDDAGAAVIGDKCLNLQTDTANCGQVGHTCPSAETSQCDAGKCSAALSFSGDAPNKSCDALCASVGLKCQDAGGFSCNFQSSALPSAGNHCGEVTGADYDNSGIPGGGSAGINWHGAVCATVVASRTDHLYCHCME